MLSGQRKSQRSACPTVQLPVAQAGKPRPRDGDCNDETKRCLLLGIKAMTNLDSIFKSRDITLLTKVCIVKAMVVMRELDHKEG